MTTHSVAELREAWRAIEAGEFARGPRSATAARNDLANWTPSQGERVVAVVGCAGGVGASTLALALASKLENNPKNRIHYPEDKIMIG